LLTSCGTLLYPERRGQPAGRLDAGVVVLDAVGLLLFFVPGVVAFIVDFATGAIYLPPDCGPAGPALAMEEMRKVPIDPADLTPQRVEAVVHEQTGKSVSLRPGEYRAKRLDKLTDFTPETLAEIRADATPTRVTFRGCQE
jgi:hypothetical protein